ncbi:MAG: hypothetical protein KatS3mg005_4102 [Bryobacteraceae bacterium]|nr:MAG: hypothetical protein KatS3mg005_4102 [Bryobacteraceae bacterium]
MKRMWLLAGVLIIAGGMAWATPVSLQTLIDTNGTVTSGDKVFSNFEAVLTIFGSGTATPTDLSGVQVNPITQGGLFGLQLTGGMYAACTPGNCPTTWNLNVSWDVTAASPYLIDGVYLSINGGASNPPDSIVTVSEVVYDGLNIVGNGLVYYPSVLMDLINLPQGYSKIRVNKDILLVANVEQGFAFAKLSDVRQLYRQTGEIPEPGTYALIGAGLAALGLLRRRIG